MKKTKKAKPESPQDKVFDRHEWVSRAVAAAAMLRQPPVIHKRKLLED